MRLIDADALKRNVLKWMPKEQSDYMDSTIPPLENLTVSMVMEIDDAPTVDAVPVVRCKDCRFSDWYTAVDGKERCYCMEHGSSGHEEMDFCSYGENDGEHEQTD